MVNNYGVVSESYFPVAKVDDKNKAACVGGTVSANGAVTKTNDERVGTLHIIKKRKGRKVTAGTSNMDVNTEVSDDLNSTAFNGQSYTFDSHTPPLLKHQSHLNKFRPKVFSKFLSVVCIHYRPHVVLQKCAPRTYCNLPGPMRHPGSLQSTLIM
jgi:hypothetical protein